MSSEEAASSMSVNFDAVAAGGAASVAVPPPLVVGDASEQRIAALEAKVTSLEALVTAKDDQVGNRMANTFGINFIL